MSGIQGRGCAQAEIWITRSSPLSTEPSGESAPGGKPGMCSCPGTGGIMMHSAVGGKGHHDWTAENRFGLRDETGVKSSRAL